MREGGRVSKLSKNALKFSCIPVAPSCELVLEDF